MTCRRSAAAAAGLTKVAGLAVEAADTADFLAVGFLVADFLAADFLAAEAEARMAAEEEAEAVVVAAERSTWTRFDERCMRVRRRG